MPGHDTLSSIGPLLDGLGIRWIVIGAVAANRYRREVRLTGDLGLLLSSHGPGLVELEAAVGTDGWRVRRGTPDGAILRLRHATRGSVDLILAETEYQHSAIERSATEARANRTTIRVLRLEDVLVHKLIAGRPRDVADIEDILASRPTFDEDYVVRWADYWDVLPLWQRLRDEARP